MLSLRTPWILCGAILCVVLLLALAFDASSNSRLLINTARLVLGTCLLSLPLGAVLAVLIVRTDLPGRRLAGALLALALLLPLYIQAASWKAGFGVLGWYSLANPGWVFIDGWRGALWIHALAALPWVALLVAGGLRFVEPELEEQALLDATPAMVFRRVTLRRVAVAMSVAGLWVAVGVAGEMTVTDLFQVRTFAEELYTQIRLGALPSDVTLGLLPGLGLLAALAAAALWACSQVAPAMRQPSVRLPLTFCLGRVRWPVAICVWALLLMIFGLPLVNLLFKTGVVVTADSDGFHRSWSLVKCLRLIAESPWRYGREFRWSLILSSLSATLAVLAALPLAWWARKGRAGSVAALTLVSLGLALPGPMIGFGLIWFFNRPEVPLLQDLYDRSLAAPLAALFLKGWPLATLVLWPALASVPSETLDAAATDGAGPLTRFWRIALPQRLPALGVAWLVAFALALADLSASILVLPPGVMTLANLIFDKLHGAQEDDVSSICLALIAVFATLIALIERLLRRWRM